MGQVFLSQLLMLVIAFMIDLKRQILWFLIFFGGALHSNTQFNSKSLVTFFGNKVVFFKTFRKRFF